MAASTALADRQIVSTTLHFLSDMKYKERRQYGPDQPVEFLEFRPTLVPAILVNKLWADEGTSILWRRYPHIQSLKHMSPTRRQYYANKVHYVFSLSPSPGSAETMDYLDGLAWPNLKSLELEADFHSWGSSFMSMLHDRLEHVELSGYQGGGSQYFSKTLLPTLFARTTSLKSLRIGSDTITDDDPVHVSALYEHLDALPSIKKIEVKSTNFMDKDTLFARLSQRSGLESLEIDLDPGVALLPLLSGPNALPSPFASLKRVWILCYPEVALALPVHLRRIEELHLDTARIPSQAVQPSDRSILEDLIAELSHCPDLRTLKIGIGLLAAHFPSRALLPHLSGSTLVRLAETCPKLENINLMVTESSSIDGSSISSDDFDQFCKSLPRLRNLSLRLHPTTVSVLQSTALQSLGQHCPDLEVLRLRVALQLPSLPVTDAIPDAFADSGTLTPELLMPQGDYASINDDSSVDAQSDYSEPEVNLPTSRVTPLFPKLTHLALSRPDSALAIPPDSFTSSTSSHSTSGIVDPAIEEDLVRSWARPLLAHFPRLDILEAWGDSSGQDNESLNYFLPTEEILASTWEFLSGIEQDLWEDDEEPFEESDDWDSLEDWEKASLMNEFIVDEEEDVYREVGKLSVRDEEPEGMITPRTLGHEDYYE